MHADGGWCKWVIGREHKGAPVLTTFVGGLGRASEYVVPLKDVLF